MQATRIQNSFLEYTTSPSAKASDRFLSVRRTVSCEILSTTLNFTNLSANRRSVHFSCPCGAGLQASAIRRVSPQPSSFRLSPGCGSSLKALLSNPPSAKRLRVRSTVGRQTMRQNCRRFRKVTAGKGESPGEYFLFLFFFLAMMGGATDRLGSHLRQGTDCGFDPAESLAQKQSSRCLAEIRWKSAPIWLQGARC